jgi:hypothetical protein
MAIVPIRDVPAGLAAAENATVPFPLPLAPPVTLSQAGVPVAAVHVQPAGALTAVVPLTAFAPTETLVGASEYVHGAPDWFTVKVCPPTEIVPWRACDEGFASTSNVNASLPLPLAPLVTVSHNGALLTAVQLHPSGELTDVDPVVPAAVTVVLAGDIEYVHGAGA